MDTRIELIHLPVADVDRAKAFYEQAGWVVDHDHAVTDDLLAQNHWSFRLRGGPDGAEVTATRDQPDVSLGIRELGMLYLGGSSPATLRQAGLIGEHTPDALTRMAAAFAWDRLPYCNDYF